MSNKQRAALAGVVLGTIAAVTGVIGAAPRPARAQAPTGLTGLVKIQSQVVTDSTSPKLAKAECPATKKVVGGGGWAFETSGTNPERLTLTRLEPSDDVNGTGSSAGPDGYIAAAAETSPGTAGNWWVQAYAICADATSVPGWELEAAYSPTLSQSAQVQDVGCDANDLGKRVIGTGARIGVFSQGEVVLQSSAPVGGRVRARAHEDGNGYAGTWWLGAYAICADRPAGFLVVSAESTERLSEPEKFAEVWCPTGTRVLSAGGLIRTTALGNVSLQQVFPSLSRVSVFAVEHAQYFDDWDAIVAVAVCAQATLG
jgi:hypothetical protein